MNNFPRIRDFKQSILIVLIMLVCSPASAQFNLDKLVKDVKQAAASKNNTATSSKSGVSTTEQKSTTTAEFNSALFGKFSNQQDPIIDMTLSKKATANKDFNNTKVYGKIMVANEYFEYEYIIYITAITPKGKNITATVIVTQMQGDPEAGDVSYVKKGKATVTIIPVDGGVKIQGCDKIPSQKLVKTA